jgi:hypothetical protein
MEQELKYVKIYVNQLHKMYLKNANEELEKHKNENPLLILSKEYHLNASKEYLSKAQAIMNVIEYINN